MKRFILTFSFLIFSFFALRAQNTAYAQLNNGILTFKYGVMPSSGNTYSVPLNAQSMSAVPWYPDKTQVTKVVFDPSFSSVNNIISLFMWFANMSNLTQIDGIENLNTSNVINMMSTFAFTSLTSIDLSNFNTERVETMQAMFAGSTSLYSLDLSSFVTPNLYNTSYMFSMNAVDPILTTIDMSSIDLSKVTATDGMFQGNYMLKTVYCNSDCSASSVLVTSTNMFNGCTRIVGGNGTTYDANHIDASYARPDLAGSMGYFTGVATPEPEFVVTLLSNPAGVGVLTGAGTYHEGDVATVTATADEGYDFIGWTVNGALLSENETYSFLVTSNITLTANFRFDDGIGEDNSSVVRFYPNPLIGDDLNIECDGLTKLYVFDCEGRMCCSNNVENNAVVNTSGWKSGTYIVMMVTKSGVVTRKLIKQ